MSQPKEETECIVRCVIRDGPQLESLVRHLTDMFGAGMEMDTFHERLLFVPHNDPGNMNVIHRESSIGIEYMAEKETCTVKYYGAPISVNEVPGLHVEVVGVTRVTASINIRRTLLKTGFTIKADYAQKGLKFLTRQESQTVCISRPYNASLIDERVYREGVASWDSLPGPFPFGRDYLLEMRRTVDPISTPEDVLGEFRALLDKLIT